MLMLFTAIGLAQADMFRPSIQKQIELGKEAAKQIRKEEKVLPSNDPRVKELRRLGTKLIELIPAKERKDRPFEYTFDVIDSNELNAFALPGGPVFFYTGLLDKLDTEDEIVGILAHEITHVQNMHWANQYGDGLKRQLGLIAVLTIINANDDWFRIGSLLDSLNGLQYSRKHETEADRQGYDLMLRANYNPQGMVDVFTILNEASKGSRPPEFLSTHPDTGNRIKAIQKWMTEYRERFPKLTKRKSAKSLVTWDSTGWATLTQTPSLPVGTGS